MPVPRAAMGAAQHAPCEVSARAWAWWLTQRDLLWRSLTPWYQFQERRGARLFAFVCVLLFVYLFVQLFDIHSVPVFVRDSLTMFVFNTQSRCYGVFDLLKFCAMFRRMFHLFLQCSVFLEHYQNVAKRCIRCMYRVVSCTDFYLFFNTFRYVRFYLKTVRRLFFPAQNHVVIC